MPSYPHIEQYRTKLQELNRVRRLGQRREHSPSVQNCLDSYCLDHRERLVLIPELKTSPSNKPDGTVKDSLRMARGYWEAKDSHDDLDAEIQAKFNRGYPKGNIIFEDSQTAVLVQKRQRGDAGGYVPGRGAAPAHPGLPRLLTAGNRRVPPGPPAVPDRPARRAGKPAPRPWPTPRQATPPTKRAPPASSSSAARASVPPSPPPTCARCCCSTSSPRTSSCACSPRTSSTERTTSPASSPPWSALSSRRCAPPGHRPAARLLRGHRPRRRRDR